MDLSAFERLKSVPKFDGKAGELSMFILRVNEIRKHVAETFLTIFDISIRHRIVKEANFTLINNGSPTNWEIVRKILKENFKVHGSYSNDDSNDFVEYLDNMDEGLGKGINYVES